MYSASLHHGAFSIQWFLPYTMKVQQKDLARIKKMAVSVFGQPRPLQQQEDFEQPTLFAVDVEQGKVGQGI